MDLFVVKTKEGKTVSKGFASKTEAKQMRNKLQAESGSVPPVDKRHIEKEWSFKVSKGKDHTLSAK